MKFPTEKIVRLTILGTLYTLASPIYLGLGLAKLRRILKLSQLLATTTITCLDCGHQTALHRLATCNRCHATEYGSILYCSFCGQVTYNINCEECGVTLRVIPKVSF